MRIKDAMKATKKLSQESKFRSPLSLRERVPAKQAGEGRCGPRDNGGPVPAARPALTRRLRRHPLPEGEGTAMSAFEIISKWGRVVPGDLRPLGAASRRVAADLAKGY